LGRSGARPAEGHLPLSGGRRAVPIALAGRGGADERSSRGLLGLLCRLGLVLGSLRLLGGGPGFLGALGAGGRVPGRWESPILSDPWRRRGGGLPFRHPWLRLRPAGLF